MSDKYKQSQVVYFKLKDEMPPAAAYVCGVIGPIVIIEPVNPIPGYDFSHIYVIDSQIVDAPAEVVQEEVLGAGETGAE